MRAFVAVTIPKPFRDALAAEAASLARVSHHVRTVAPENLHLTLAFLGDVPAQSTDSVRSGMQAAVRGRHPFSIGFSGGGTFPANREPRIAWAGISGETEALRDLQAAVLEAVRGLGLRVDPRPFSPHVTLARIGRMAAPSARRVISRGFEAMEFDRLGLFTVSHISLMESDLTPAGAVHHEAFSVDFAPEEESLPPRPRPRPRRRFGLF